MDSHVKTLVTVAKESLNVALDALKAGFGTSLKT